MGIKKLSKKLEKLGRKARLGLGKGGKEWVEAVYKTAIGVIEDELRKRPARPAQKSTASPKARSRRPVVPTSRKTEGGRTSKLAVKRDRAPRKRPSVQAAGEGPHAHDADPTPAEPVGLAPPSRPELPTS